MILNEITLWPLLMGVVLLVHGIGAQAIDGCTQDPAGDRSGVLPDWAAGYSCSHRLRDQAGCGLTARTEWGTRPGTGTGLALAVCLLTSLSKPTSPLSSSVGLYSSCLSSLQG